MSGGLLSPLARALAQLDDPAFLGVLWRSLAWSAACFIVLLIGAIWGVQHVLAGHAIWAWLAGIVSGLGAALLAFWLFLPVAAVIGTLYLERIARAVERRFYPGLAPAQGAPAAVQVWDGLAVGARILLLNILALILALLIPGIGLVIAWAIGAYAIGRGLFVAVAMRRMSRPDAQALYHRRRLAVLAQGGILALAGYIPLLNLLIPVVGTAAMVHILDRRDG
ncbi:MAG: EI24 domain-containing protein [Alphaproteobacteria bacterium]|nr:EI24 domain-containing protein [Alphaproteobacteria bacterium]